MQGDAANPKTVSSLVDRVIKEEGRLDFFFANAGISHVKRKPKEGQDPAIAGLENLAQSIDMIEAEEYNEVMRINALG